MQAHLDKANAQMKTLDPLNALDDINAIIALDMASVEGVEALVLRGRLDDELGGPFGTSSMDDAIRDHDAALAMAAKVTDGGPQLKRAMGMAYRARANARNHRRDWKEAVADWDEALKIDPRNVEALIGRAESDSNFGSGLFSNIKEEPEVEPLADFAAALAIDPKSGHAYVARGKFYGIGFSNAKSLKQSFDEYDKAVEIDPTYADGWFYRGHTRGRLVTADYKFGDDQNAQIANRGNAEKLAKID